MDENNTNALAETTAPQGTETPGTTEADAAMTEQDTTPAQSTATDADSNSDSEQGVEAQTGETADPASAPFFDGSVQSRKQGTYRSGSGHIGTKGHAG